MEGPIFFIGILGNVFSMLVYLSPISTFQRIVKQKSTEEFQYLPYICALLSASLWTYYGIVKPGAILVATVNGFGAVVESIYVALFLLFAPPKVKVKIAVLVGVLDVGFLVASIFVTRLAFQGEDQIVFMGFLSAALSIIMYGSPLASIRTVVATKSVEYMPFLLSFFLFLAGGTWAIFGWLSGDYFVLVPNGTGFIFGTCQLLLYAIYKNKKSSSHSIICDVDAASKLEEGWQQREPLLSSDQSSET